MAYYAIIVAGGSGKRMEAGIPKQFLLLGSKPILMHTIEAFSTFCKVVVVLPTAHIYRWRCLCEQYNFNIPHEVVEGGSERFYSVKNALVEIPDNAVVAVHDGVRPFVSARLVCDALRTARKNKSAIPVLRAVDTLRQKVDVSEFLPIDRKTIYSVQTPQAFNSTLLKKAYNMPYSPEFTDDATVFEKNGNSLCFIEGERLNFKITTPQDLILARAVLCMTKGSE